MELMVNDLNSFGFELFHNLYDERVNFTQNSVVSSISIYIAMLMAFAGSGGNTRNELITSLKLNNILPASVNGIENPKLIFLHESINRLIKTINENENSTNKSNHVLVANKMILNRQNVKSSFENLIKSYYNAKVDKINSSQSYKLIIDETNKWISNLTNNKISNILDDNFKTSSIALMNVFYFKNEWLYEFNQNDTKKTEFYLTPNRRNSVAIDMMKLNNKPLLYFKSNLLNCHILSLPYKNKKYFFNILFPVNENDFLLSNDNESLVNKLNYDVLKNEMQHQSYKNINLKIPKFVIKQNLEVSSALKKMGIRSAFDSKTANFSKMTNSAQLFIEQVLQYSFIEVNEKGTVAAAVTMIKFLTRSSLVNPVIHINLNRPFIYYISENSTGAILLFGNFNGLFSSNNAISFKRVDSSQT